MEGDIDFFLTGSMPPPSSQLYFQTLHPACILAFLASIPEAILQGPSSLGAGATSCASFITHALPVPWGVPALLKSWSQHMDISMAAAPPQPHPSRDLASKSCQAKGTEPGAGSGPGSIYDFLSQGLCLGTLHSGNVPPSPVHTHVFTWKRGEQWVG